MSQPARFDDPEAISHLRPKRPSLPCTAPESSPGRNASLSKCGKTLARVDELGPQATGALVFEEPGGQRGAILIENGRICWAAAAGLSRRMIEILRLQEDSGAQSAQDFETVFRSCQLSGHPFGEELVKLKMVSEDGLRRALRQHTAEGVSLIAEHATQVRFLEHRGQGYAARFTFSTAEVMCSIGALKVPEVAAASSNRLRQLLPSGVSGVVYSRGLGAAPVALGVWETSALTAFDLSSIAQWASGALDISGALGDAARVMAVTDPAGRSIALWQDGELMYAAICPDASSLARVMMGVSRR